MKKLLLIATPILGLALSSCYIDPYAANYGYEGGYSSGGGYSSSFFVSTGSPQWAYDPYRYCYYDRYRRSYYDPYLYGYYPSGYVPAAVRGCPHPYGWSGSGYCPPPRSVNSRILGKYDQRLSNYAAAEYHWARRVQASGSPQWLGSSERENLYQRSYGKNQPSKVSGWMGGSGLSNQQDTFRQTPTIFGSSSRSQPSVIRQSTPTIQPRNTTGGLFGGLDRNRSIESSSGLRESRVEIPRSEPRIERSQPRIEIERSEPRIERSEPRIERSEPESSGLRGGLDRGGDDSGGGGGGEGLRKFRF